MWTLCSLLVAAAPSFVGAPTLRIAGTVVERDGRPSEGAQVFLGSPLRLPPFGTQLEARGWCDASGEFELEVPESWIERCQYKRLTLWAWKPGRALAAVSYEARDVPVAKRVKLELGPPARSPLEVSDPDGKPVVGARVVPHSLRLGDMHEVPPPELETQLVSVTDEHGRTSVDAWPLADVGVLQIESDAWGVQVLSDGESRPPEWGLGRAKLKPVARLNVRVDGEPPDRWSALHVSVRSMVLPPATEGRRSGSNHVSCTLEGDVGTDGRLTLAPLVAGSPMVAIRCSPREVQRPTCGNVVLEAGKESELAITWKRGMRVSGRVVTRDGERPIANARLQWFQYPTERCELVTDADGRFSVGAFPGAGAIEGISVDAPFVGVPDFGCFRFSLPKDVDAHELPPIRLAVGVSIAGVVRNGASEAIPGAWVCARWNSTTHGRQLNYTTTALADEAGRFVLRSIEDGAALEVTARFAGAAMDEPMKVTARADAPIEIKLDAAGRVALRGRVLDEQGKPIVDAEVEVWQAPPENHVNGEKRVGTGSLRTGADGRFATARELSPDKTYCVRVKSSGLLTTRTPWSIVAPSASLDVVMRSLARVEGILLDEYKKPVAGARVFARDAPAEVETRTDEQGRFALDGVAPGKVVVLVQNGAASVHARVVDAPAKAIEWMLISESDSRSQPSRTRDATVPRTRELEIAWSLVGPRIERAIEAKKSSDICSALSDAAPIDPASVLKRLEDGVLEGFLADVVRARMVDSLALHSPDDAVLVTRLQQPWARAVDLTRIAQALPAEEREQKLELLSEAAVEAPRVGAPEYELVVLARIAAALVDLGEMDAARKFIDRGLPLVDKLPAEQWPGFARSCFAEALAHFDLDRALAIVAQQKDNMEHERHIGNIAHRLAASQPENAERAWKSLQTDRHGYAASWLPRICHAMASSDPARAHRIALEGEGSDAAYALGMMALAVAQRDRPAAITLLDEAFDMLANLAAHDARRGEFRDLPIVGAALLPVVEQVDPGRVREFVCKTLALRQLRKTGENLWNDSTPFASDAGVAMLVARYDREVARTLLVPVLEYLKLGNRHSTSHWVTGTVAAALAVTDPEWALELSQSVLPERARATITRVLARTGTERWDFVQDEYANLWVVGKEDL